MELHKVANCVNLSCLQAVQSANAQIQIKQLGLQELTHMQYILVELLGTVLVLHVHGDLLVVIPYGG